MAHNRNILWFNKITFFQCAEMMNDKFITVLLRRRNKMPIQYLSVYIFHLAHAVLFLNVIQFEQSEFTDRDVHLIC